MLNRRDLLTAIPASALLSALPSWQLHAASMRNTFRAWEVGAKGGFDTLRMVERNQSSLDDYEVAIKVNMCSLNARDQAIVKGWFLEDKPADLIPLTSGCGEVVATGARVTRVAAGDRVTSAHFSQWVDGLWDPVKAYAADIGNTIDGWLTEQATMSETGLVKLPDNVSDETGASIASAGVTTWQALHHVARVKPGDTVLSLGTGGVSTWGVQLAKMAGARVVVTSSSDDKLKRMRELGADITINYKKTPEWGKAVMEQTGGQGANIVLENVGRATLDQSLMASANNATVILIGTGRLPENLPKMPGFYMKNITMKAISNASRTMLEEMVDAISANQVSSVIDKVFDFEDVVDAFEYMSSSKHLGKILIKV